MLTVVIVKVVGDIGRIGIILMCVIKESYPVYVQEKAVDSGKKVEVEWLKLRKKS